MDEPRRLSESDANDPLARLLRGAQAMQVDYDLSAAVARHERLVAAGVRPLAPAGGHAWRGVWIGCAIAVVAVAAMWGARSGGDDRARPAVVVLESPVVARASIDPAPVIAASPAVVDAALVEPTPATPRPRESSVVRRAAPRAAASAATPADDDRIAREAAQVRRIRELLDAGDAAAALRACDDGDREFARGVFTVERDGLRVLAAVALGRPRAHENATAYLDAHPRAPLAGRIRRALGETAE